MNLWIRSQKNNDNTRPILLKVESLELGDDYDDMNCIVANNLYNIGTYKNKERALEVLDEIQNILKPKIYYECNENPIYNSHKEYGNDGNIYETHIYTTSSIKMEPKLKSIEINDYVYEMPEE